MKSFSIYVVSGVVAISTMFAAATPALAAITTTQLTAASPNSNGPCPFTETFTGTINGTPGTSFQYSFNRYINGTQQVQNVGAATIPAAGSVAVSDSFTINGTSAGLNFDQIWVHNIAGGQSDVYSSRAAFSVNCATVGPSPASSPVNFSKFGLHTTSTANQLVFGVPPPYNVGSTTDPHVCGKHGGLAGVFCIQAVPDKYLILIWDWEPNDKWPSIDGYHIYDVTGGGKMRVQDQTNPQATIEFFKPGSFTGKCYAVSAYKGTHESASSASFCVAGAQIGVKSITIPNPTVGSRHEEYTLGGLGDSVEDCDAACIGYFYNKVIIAGVVAEHANVIYRGYMTFHPSGVTLRGLNVAKATLSVALDLDNHPNMLPNKLACLGAVGAAKTDWLASKAFADGDFGYDVPAELSGSSGTFDVTRIVRDWASGAIPNYGFVFKGTSENLGSDDNDECRMVLHRNAVLWIEYY